MHTVTKPKIWMQAERMRETKKTETHTNCLHRANRIRKKRKREQNWPLCAQRKIIFIGIVNICTRIWVVTSTVQERKNTVFMWRFNFNAVTKVFSVFVFLHGNINIYILFRYYMWNFEGLLSPSLIGIIFLLCVGQYIKRAFIILDGWMDGIVFSGWEFQYKAHTSQRHIN